MVSFLIGDLACVALSLDGPRPMIDDRILSVTREGRRNLVTCSLSDARYLLDLAENMATASRGGEGWAIGIGERRACRKAAETIRVAVLIAESRAAKGEGA